MFDFRPVATDWASLKRYADLLASCFGEMKKFTPEALHWLYAQNPSGMVCGFDAFCADELAGHYVCVPTCIRLGGEEKHALLSLNTATHPRWRGQGLFTKLAERTYEAAHAAGFAAVYGVANANSTPGFIHKLGFELIQPLTAQIGWGGMVSGDSDSESLLSDCLQRAWNEESLRWRCANPANPVIACQTAQGSRFFASALPAVSAHAFVPNIAFSTPAPPFGVTQRYAPLRLDLGLIPLQSRRSGVWFSIPQRLRPSPLNFIFKPLADPGARAEKGKILFSFLDFDAY